MAKQLSDILTRLAYRMGEDSSPTDSSEKARRVNAIAEGYEGITTDEYWWWTEASTTFNTVANQQTYTTADGFPSDFRDMVELRVDSKVYTYIPKSKVFGLYDKTTAIFNYDNLTTDKHWYIFDDTLYLYPTPGANGTNNIEMKYLKYPTIPSADSDTFDIPDIFSRALDAYAYGKLKSLEGKRGTAADAFAEYSEIIGKMQMEQNRRLFSGKAVRPIHPTYLVD